MDASAPLALQSLVPSAVCSPARGLQARFTAAQHFDLESQPHLRALPAWPGLAWRTHTEQMAMSDRSATEEQQQGTCLRGHVNVCKFLPTLCFHPHYFPRKEVGKDSVSYLTEGGEWRQSVSGVTRFRQSDLGHWGRDRISGPDPCVCSILIT